MTYSDKFPNLGSNRIFIDLMIGWKRRLLEPEPKKETPGGKPLGLFFVVVVMFGITTTLHGLSPLATYGLGAVFFLMAAVCFYLIPAGLVSAELATTFQREGGVYVWVGEAFGPSAGFMATWLQWAQNIVFWTVILTGSASMLAIGFGWENGAENELFTVVVVVGAIWLTTGLTLLGLRSTGWVGTVGSLAGTIFPGIILIFFATVYLSEGHPSHMAFDISKLIPDLSQRGNLTFGISTIMIFAGIELMGTRVSRIQSPGMNYPRATWLSIVMTCVLLIPLTLAIAILVPIEELKITAGIVQAVKTVFSTVWHLKWIAALFAIALLLDSIGEIAGWMAGTPIAMARAARDGFLPKKLMYEKRETAHNMLIIQAIIGSAISILFIVEPTVVGVFWVLSALLVQLYVMMYILLFAGVWRLRYKHPELERPFRIPGGNLGVALVSIIGILFSLAVLVVGFIPPLSMDLKFSEYEAVLIVALLVALGVPGILILRQRKRQTS